MSSRGGYGGYGEAVRPRGRWRAKATESAAVSSTEAQAVAERAGTDVVDGRRKVVLKSRREVEGQSVPAADDEHIDEVLPPRTKPRQFPRAAPVRADTDDRKDWKVCVVGGGPSGLGCCRALCEAGLQVTLVQESRGLGGKLCTKFVNGKDDPTLHFDMGVQLLLPDGHLREALGPSVEPWPRQGRFKAIQCAGEWGNWRLVGSEDLPTDGYVVGVPSMSNVGRHLASLCPGLIIHIDRTAAVRGRDPKTGRWEVEWKREAATAGQLRYRPELKDVPTQVGQGDFDAVVLAFEANKIVRGCKSGYKMVQPSATPYVRSRIAGRARTSQMWNLMVAFDSELPMPWDAAVVLDHPAISWVAVNSSKPERARVPQCFMVFSTQKWADWKQWGKREVEHELLEEFLHFLSVVLGRRPPRPSFVLSGRWGNNTETVLTGDPACGEFPMRAVGHHKGPGSVVWDEKERIGATGDWTRGYSVSDAYDAGHEIAQAIVTDLCGSSLMQSLDQCKGA